MNRLFASLVIVAAAIGAAPAARADLTDDLLQASLNDLVAWDPGFAPFASDPPPSSGHDFVVGSQKVTVPASDNFQHIRISAHSGPTGQDPKGMVQVSYRSLMFPGGSADVYGDVICLNVISPPLFLPPPTAFVWARLRQPIGTWTYVQLRIHDVGNPGPFMGQSPDKVYFYLSQTGPDPTCGASGTTLAGSASGNYIVKDST